MTDEFQAGIDLFGEAVTGPRGPGRPAVEWTLEKSNRVNALFAMGYEPKEAAPVIGCCLKTFRKVFSAECRERKLAELKLRAGMVVQLIDQGQKGNVAAIKAAVGMIERAKVQSLADRMILKQQRAVRKGKGDAASGTAPVAVGLKAERDAAASRIDGLFARRPTPVDLVK